MTIVCNVYEHEAPIAEYVLCGILDHEIGLSRAVEVFSGEAWGAQFRGRVPHGEAMGKTIGIVGMGRIGKAIAVRARAFGIRVIGVNRSGRPVPEADEIRFAVQGQLSRGAPARPITWSLPARLDRRERAGLIDAAAFCARMEAERRC